MTAPVRSVADLDAESAAFERAAVESVTAALRSAVGRANAALEAQYARLASRYGEPLPDTQGQALADLAQRLFRDVEVRMADQFAREVQRGLRMGANQAREYADDSVRGNRIVDTDLRAVVRRLDRRVRDQLDLAVGYASTGPIRTRSDLAVVQAAATRAVSRARMDVAWATNRAVNAGAVAVMDALGQAAMWVAERDACLDCLAYSGLIVRPGMMFPGGLTFSTRPSRHPAVPYPPLHPWCRCRVVPDTGLLGTPTGLQREARRSVLRGDSAYASLPERLSAADELLRRGAGLPATVERRAARAVRAGRFETEDERQRRRRS